MKKYLIILPIIAGLCFFASAQAAIITISPYIPGTASVGSNSPGNYIVNFYQLALMFGGILAFGAIVYGAIKYAISPGNPSGLSEARAWIQSALLGLLLLVAAYLILYTVNPSLVDLSLPSLGNVSTNEFCAIPCGTTCCSTGQACSTSNTCVSLTAPTGPGSCPTRLCGGVCCAVDKCTWNVQTGASQCGN